jgi:hypothetical protein
MGKDINAGGLSRRHIMLEVENSLPIIGARNVEQLEYSLAAINVDMAPEWRNEISSLSVTPAPATDRGETLLPIWK